MNLIHLERVEKVYEGGVAPVTALAAIDLTIGQQEFVSLMGPSGSGKSTLLGIVGAMSEPSRGRVLVDEIDVYRLNVERRADFRRAYLGFVFQQLYLVPHLSAVENVMLPLAASRVTSRQQRGMALDALDRVGLADKAARLPQALSGGEQQRVAIARAIVNHPPIVLADEPTGCLDSRHGRSVMELFLALQATGLTIFMVTHDRAVAAYADRTIVLKDGLIVSQAEGSCFGASQDVRGIARES
jgi:putative ABC transport system ATP-binding protein